MIIENIKSELVSSYSHKSLWLYWGWLDIRQKYRRSFFGPFWVTMTMGLSILAIGLVYAYLFNQDVKNYLPYVAVGFVVWSLISGYIGEATSVFIQNEGFIKQMPLPLLVYSLRMLWRYFIIFLHHAVILVIIFLVFTPVDLTNIAASLIGLILVCINIFWIGLALGLLSVKMRDIPILITTIFQLLFLITPIIWPAKALGSRLSIALWNPFYHFLEVIRQPLIGGLNDLWLTHLLITAILGVVGTGIALFLLGLWKKRIVFWL
jgi:ABC-2 type transport system permease protein